MQKKLKIVSLTMVFLFSFTGIASSALTSAFRSIDGHVGAEMAAFPAGYASSASGSLALSTIPVGATILKATLYGNNYFGSSLTPGATFAGNSLGTTSAFATDGAFSAFKWDVTGLVTGNGSYSASYTGLSNSYGLALAVVFSDAGLPLSRVTINDGAIDFSLFWRTRHHCVNHLCWICRPRDPVDSYCG